MNPEPTFDAAGRAYQQTRIAHWDALAKRRDTWRGGGGWYHRRLLEIFRFLVGPDQRILEIGCGEGGLLAALHTSHGVGVDFSTEMIQRGKARHPELEFILADAHDLSALTGPFDAIVLSDTVNDLWDVQRVFEQLRPLCTPRTRLILNFYSHLWEFPLAILQRLGLASPTLDQNWLTREDLSGMLHLAGFEPIRFT